jgi:competence protein ComEC
MSWRERFTGRPLALLAVAAVIGIVIADRTAAASGIVIIWGVLAMGTAWLAWARESWRWSLLLCLFTFALLHTLELRHTRLHPLRASLEKRTTSMPIIALGRIEQPLRRDLPGAEPGEATFVATEVRNQLSGEIWRGPITLQMFPGEGIAPPTGEYRVEGWLRLPMGPDNPGQFDGRYYDLRLGLVAELRPSRLECLEQDRWSISTALMGAAARCREWVKHALQVDLGDHANERTIILAMALGAIEPGARELQKPFRESGTLHIFAVSGLHVVIVGFIFMALLRPWGLRRGVLVLLLVLALFGYAFITGWKPSAVRAAVMFTVVLAGSAWHRRPDLLNSLGAAALLLIAFDTHQVFFPGFQLSFGVVAAIAILVDYFTRPLRSWIDPDEYLPKPLLTGWQKIQWNARRGFVGLFTVSAAATIGSLPLIFAHFHLVTPISLIANAVLVPLSFCILATAILTLGCGMIHITFLQVLFSNANLAFAWAALHAAQLFAGLPLANFQIGHVSFSARPQAQLTVLRMSSGAAAQHLHVGGREWLLDTGAEEHVPFLMRPYLQYMGVNRLDGLILSHSDSEHVGAAVRMQSEFREPQVWQPAREPWRGERGGLYKLQKAGVHATPLAQGATLDLGPFAGGAAHAKVLHPTMNNWSRRGDDRTLVLRLDFGRFRILWCNDAGFLAEKTLLETLPREELRCDVIVRNQHASDYTMIPDFLDAVRPRVMVSSNDDFPTEQKLPQRIRDECAKRGIRLLDQAETGAVMLKIWPERVEVDAMRAFKRTVLLPAAIEQITK